MDMGIYSLRNVSNKLAEKKTIELLTGCKKFNDPPKGFPLMKWLLGIAGVAL